jgi:formyltetrahydrofolate-dependent phosphoribosylglycinamide formyltransferase
MPPRLVVLISGSGTNLQALLDAVAGNHLQAEIAAVVSNRKAAYGLIRAEAGGVPTLYFPLKRHTENGRSREEYDSDLADQVEAYHPDLIVLAGWMHVLSPAFLNRFPNRVINLHPALPGAFPGSDAIRRTYEAYLNGDLEDGGCMVHYVVPEVDAGPVLIQATVPVMPDDTLDTFEARMHSVEHQIIVQAVRLALEQIGTQERS